MLNEATGAGNGHTSCGATVRTVTPVTHVCGLHQASTYRGHFL